MPKTNTEKGDALEKLVNTIEASINAGTQDVLIETKKKLKDKIGKNKREFDVALTYRLPGRDLICAIECKDWKRDVGSEIIESFNTKCNDCGIHRRVIVSPLGFTKPALDKAAHYEIQCIALNSVDNLDWILNEKEFPEPQWTMHSCTVVARSLKNQDKKGKAVPNIELINSKTKEPIPIDFIKHVIIAPLISIHCHQVCKVGRFQIERELKLSEIYIKFPMKPWMKDVMSCCWILVSNTRLTAS